MNEHPIKQPIEAITVWNGNEGLVEVGAYEPEGYRVGYQNVTRIEACTKPGLHCDIPYVRVWSDETCIAEFCQHGIVGVYFGEAEIADTPVEEAPRALTYDDVDPDCFNKIHIGGKPCQNCWIPF